MHREIGGGRVERMEERENVADAPAALSPASAAVRLGRSGQARRSITSMSTESGTEKPMMK